MKTRKLEEILEKKSEAVLSMNTRRQNEVKQKNEEALARARDNESRILAAKRKSHRDKHKLTLELEYRKSEENRQKSLER